jgi:hypothetical protein
MTTWDKARDAKTERQRREQRHFYPEHLGRLCAGGCGLRVVAATGEDCHATCGPDVADLMQGAR